MVRMIYRKRFEKKTYLEESGGLLQTSFGALLSMHQVRKSPWQIFEIVKGLLSMARNWNTGDTAMVANIERPDNMDYSHYYRALVHKD